MGLDGVEFVMTVEEEFGIEIRDSDTWELTTPRKMATYVQRRLAIRENSNEPHCRSQANFYHLRANFVEHLGLKRREVRLDSPLERIFQSKLRTHWQTLWKAGCFRSLPSLQPPKYSRYLLITAPLMVGSFSFALGANKETILICALLAWVMTNAICRRLANQLPDHLRHVRDLLPYVGPANNAALSPEEILNTIIELTAKQIGAAPETISPDAAFVDDLGMD